MSSAAMLMRRAADFGIGFWRTTFVASLVGAGRVRAALAPRRHFPCRLALAAGTVALLFMAGSILNFISLDRGDVSIATPVLGIKIILVAVFSTLLGSQAVTPKLWIAAALSTLAIALLNRTRAAHHHHVTTTILAAGASAASFALFDVLVQQFLQGLGPGPLSCRRCSALSRSIPSALVPQFPAPLSAIPAAGLEMAAGRLRAHGAHSRWCLSPRLPGSRKRRRPTWCTAHAACGAWSPVWLIGHWFHNTEQQLGASVLRWRLIGAALMLAAIVLVLW